MNYYYCYIKIEISWSTQVLRFLNYPLHSVLCHRKFFPSQEISWKRTFFPMMEYRFSVENIYKLSTYWNKATQRLCLTSNLFLKIILWDQLLWNTPPSHVHCLEQMLQFYSTIFQSPQANAVQIFSASNTQKPIQSDTKGFEYSHCGER